MCIGCVYMCVCMYFTFSIHYTVTFCIHICKVIHMLLDWVSLSAVDAYIKIPCCLCQMYMLFLIKNKRLGGSSVEKVISIKTWGSKFTLKNTPYKAKLDGTLTTPVLGRDKHIPGAHCLAGWGWLVDSRSIRGPVPKNKVNGGYWTLILGFYVHTCVCAPNPTNMYKYMCANIIGKNDWH